MRVRQLDLFPVAVTTRLPSLVVDYFAGGGGVSEGIRLAMGRGPDVAINHDEHAIRMHEINHPTTTHLHTDVWDVDPVRDLPAGPVRLAWFSPDCTHFSRAKGKKPVSKKIRGLAWIACRVAGRRRPNVIILENVAEFRTWGPIRRGRPIKSKAGVTFRAFVGQLEALGYAVEHQILDAADYGAPTHRRRLILIARCDGQPIAWPVPTHGPGRTHPYRTAAECLDWTIPCPSIFARKKPLAEATMRRIAEGLRRYVLGSQRPFLAPVSPVGAAGAKHALVAAFLAKHNGKTTGQPVTVPLHTITGHDTKAMVACQLSPVASVDGGRSRLVAALAIKYYGSGGAQALDEPLHTIVSKARFGLVTVELDGETYAIVDIGMRMLSPRELARCQGFDDAYQLMGTQAEQVARVGNSVPPQLAAAVVKANLGARASRRAA